MYITYEDAVRRYPELEGWPGMATSVNSDLIYYAAHELNSRMASHFSVPFSAAHPTVMDLVIDLTYYRSLRTQDPKRAALIKDAIEGRIAAIKNGDEQLMTGSGTVIVPEAPGDEIWSTTQDYHPVRGMGDAEDEFVDPDRLDDEADERD